MHRTGSSTTATPRAEAERVAIVFVNFHSEAHIVPLAASYAAAGFVVSVADNSGTYPAVAGNVTRAPGNIGFGAACNAAMQAVPAGVTVVCFHNPDVAFCPDVIMAGAAAVLAQTEPGLVAPTEIADDGRREHGYAYPSAFREAAVAARRLARKVRPRTGRTGHPSHGTGGRRFGGGGLLLASVDAFLALGGYDDRYFLYAEDLDLWHRMVEAGYSATFLPEVAYDHRSHTGSPMDEDRREVLRWLGIELFAESSGARSWRLLRAVHRRLLPAIRDRHPGLADDVERCWARGLPPHEVMSRIRPALETGAPAGDGVPPAEPVRRRVVLVDEIASMGGGQSVVAEVGGALLQRDVDVHVICPAGPLARDLTSAGATWHPFAFRNPRFLTSGRRWPRPPGAAVVAVEAWRLRRMLDGLQPDLVQTASLGAHIAGRLASVGRPWTLVWHINQVHPSVLFRGPMPDRVLGVSEAAVAATRRRRSLSDRTTVVYNRIDLERFRPASQEERVEARRRLRVSPAEPVVLVVSRLEPDKGVDVVVRSAVAVHPRPVVVVAGDTFGHRAGPAFVSDLRRQARELDVDLRLLGARDDVPELLWAADLLALASRSEAFGLVLAEASACGIAVVATAVGGCMEVIEDGETGVLVPPDDDAAFATAMADLLSDADRRAVMGCKGRLLCEERFDRRTYGDDLWSFYGRLLP